MSRDALASIQTDLYVRGRLTGPGVAPDEYVGSASRAAPA
jgi:hypothetical protein